MRDHTIRFPACAAILAFACSTPAFPQQNSVAADPCARYKWDVAAERRLFAGPATPVTAAHDGRQPVRIDTQRAYRVQLAPAARVSFPVAPGKTQPSEGDYSGVLHFAVPATGSYRVAVDQAMWIDVVADHRLVPPTDYEGQHSCHAPRKIVQFTLTAGKGLILQLSSASEAQVRVTIVRAAEPADG
jgi:hypothetical protein